LNDHRIVNTVSFKYNFIETAFLITCAVLTHVQKFSFQRTFIKQVNSLKQHVQNNELFHKVGAAPRLEVRLHAWTYGVSSM